MGKALFCHTDCGTTHAAKTLFNTGDPKCELLFARRGQPRSVESLGSFENAADFFQETSPIPEVPVVSPEGDLVKVTSASGPGVIPTRSGDGREGGEEDEEDEEDVDETEASQGGGAPPPPTETKAQKKAQKKARQKAEKAAAAKNKGK